MLKKISNSLSTDNSIPIFGYSINEADIASASFFCVITVLYKAAACPHSSTPDLTSRTKLRPLSHFPGVSSVQLLGCRSKRNVTCEKAWFCPRESWDIHRHRCAVTYLVFMMCTTMIGKPDSGMARGELRSTLSLAGSCRSSATTTMTDDDVGKKARSAHVAYDGAGQQWSQNAAE